MIDARSALEHAKDWGCVYKDLARRADIPYWRFIAWMKGDSIMMPDEQDRLALLAEAYVADQKRAVDLVRANPWGIADVISIPRSTVRGWHQRMRVPLPYVGAVLEKGHDAPTPATVTADERRRISLRAASTRWGGMGPWQSVVLQRITDEPERAYLYALATDLVAPKSAVCAALNRLERRGHVRVLGWSVSGSLRRKMYGPAQKKTPAETGGRGEAGAQGVPQQHNCGSPIL